MRTRCSFPGDKAVEADRSLPSSAEVKEWVKLFLHSSITPSWRGAQLKEAQRMFWIMTPRIIAVGHQDFGRSYFLLLQGVEATWPPGTYTAIQPRKLWLAARILLVQFCYDVWWGQMSEISLPSEQFILVELRIGSGPRGLKKTWFHPGGLVVWPSAKHPDLSL
jgi:hypothetical protein